MAKISETLAVGQYSSEITVPTAVAFTVRSPQPARLYFVYGANDRSEPIDILANVPKGFVAASDKVMIHNSGNVSAIITVCTP